VFILFFGIGELSKVVIIFWASVWPILLNTTIGVKTVDPVLIRSARSMSARGATLFRKVILRQPRRQFSQASGWGRPMPSWCWWRPK